MFPSKYGAMNSNQSDERRFLLDPKAVCRGFSGRRLRREMPRFGAGCACNADLCAILEDPYPVMRNLAERRAVEAGGPGRDAGGSVWESCAGITRPAIRQ